MLTSLRAARQAISHRSRSASAWSLRRTCLRDARVSTTSKPWAETRGFASNAGRQQAHPSLEHESANQDTVPSLDLHRGQARKLPVVCPGCGAPSQTVDPDTAGFYGSRRALKAAEKSSKVSEEDEVFNNALKSGLLSDESGGQPPPSAPPQSSPSTPICDRCHYLIYQSRGTSIAHPSMQSIEQIISESPHKLNHIYHVLDAADFPLSLIPNFQSALRLPRLRTRNRRSKSINYIRGRVAEVSFIITRSDLLAPKKEQVDALLPYLREVLRDALGKSGKDLRLGNVRCVSAHRGWWTRTVKEEVYKRGGAGWVVGKVNVGKSALFEAVFPKGRGGEGVDVRAIRDKEKRDVESYTPMTDILPVERAEDLPPVRSDGDAGFAGLPAEINESHDPAAINSKSEKYTTFDASSDENLGTVDPEGKEFQESELEMLNNTTSQDLEGDDEPIFDDDSLLPPLQAETAYPDMPIVSSLPGTTASPIRIPFGNGKGELVDLPGVHRSSLETFVDAEHRLVLIMKSRVIPEQLTIKPGQSILLSGLIRITPKTDDLIVLAHPFVPLTPHVTATDKAVAIQTGLDPRTGEAYVGSVSTIATQSAQSTVKSAGSFTLKWDVTKAQSGPLTARDAGKMRAKNLPFIIYGADILIEGVGWVELTCQVRNRRKSFITESVKDAFGEGILKREVEAGPPEVEVWSPEGKFVDVRMPMNASVTGGKRKLPVHKRHSRPRQTIGFQRRKEGGRLGGARMAQVE